MQEQQQRIRTIQAYYSELALAETFKSMKDVTFYDKEDNNYLEKAQQHFRSAERLADYIAVQYSADLDKLPTMEEFLKA